MIARAFSLNYCQRVAETSNSRLLHGGLTASFHYVYTPYTKVVFDEIFRIMELGPQVDPYMIVPKARKGKQQ